MPWVTKSGCLEESRRHQPLRHKTAQTIDAVLAHETCHFRASDNMSNRQLLVVGLRTMVSHGVPNVVKVALISCNPHTNVRTEHA
jgi:hypothetical protein